MQLTELPDILTTAQVAGVIGLSTRRTRDRLNLNPNCGGIKNFAISDSPKAERRVMKVDLIAWMEDRKRKREMEFAR